LQQHRLARLVQQMAAVVAGRTIHPSPTGTPASSMARTGAMPEPSRQLEQGQCATPVRLREQGDFGGIKLDAMGVPHIRPGPAEILRIFAGRQPNLARL
jgi:hypothetical protein